MKTRNSNEEGIFEIELENEAIIGENKDDLTFSAVADQTFPSNINIETTADNDDIVDVKLCNWDSYQINPLIINYEIQSQFFNALSKLNNITLEDLVETSIQLSRFNELIRDEKEEQYCKEAFRNFNIPTAVREFYEYLNLLYQDREACSDFIEILSKSLSTINLTKFFVLRKLLNDESWNELKINESINALAEGILTHNEVSTEQVGVEKIAWLESERTLTRAVLEKEKNSPVAKEIKKIDYYLSTTSLEKKFQTKLSKKQVEDITQFKEAYLARLRNEINNPNDEADVSKALEKISQSQLVNFHRRTGLFAIGNTKTFTEALDIISSKTSTTKLEDIFKQMPVNSQSSAEGKEKINLLKKCYLKCLSREIKQDPKNQGYIDLINQSPLVNFARHSGIFSSGKTATRLAAEHIAASPLTLPHKFYR